MATEGVVSPRFELVRAAFDANFADGGEIGAGFCVMRGDEPIVDLWGGFRDRARTRTWTRDTLAPVYSTTKAVASLVIATLVDAGKFDYATPVAVVWPEFAAAGKREITIGQALSHQAGIPGFPEPIDPGLWLDPPALAAALATLAPMWPPGSASGYHALTFGYIASEITRRVERRSLGAILREDICAPLGIDFWIGLPDPEHGRCADMHRPNALPNLGAANEYKRVAFLKPWSQPNRGGPEWRRAEIASANGHGTAAAIAQLFSAYARGGAIGTMRLMDPLTYSALVSARIKGQDLILPYEMEWAAGVMRNNNRAFGPNPESLGHFGWGGSMGFADPARSLAVGYVMNRQSNALLGDARAARLIDALYSSL
jgi:CubicO group peptidase (beta-lactamase class C family)